MKYICVKSPNGIEEIFVFPRTVDHDRIQEVIDGIRVDDNRGGWSRGQRKPVSAGFVDEAGQCHGESVTLGKKSRPDIDSGILRRTLRGESQ